ncbi:class I SAM-dependent methyltransferase [Pigmentiphaga aceris]|uniref:Class I SAM-dependent methyltransferase n=1 Tax=Pigmentiphaga aceris TaxID=1940612 RepID=A0A5C0B071_9BURK|nr:class I SAM-dependent methyltransferase [Pigmentiphaga aceris]QEI07274.1 class I SAM-dependent methyltransferase [Pigmentiphaga aceris]
MSDPLFDFIRDYQGEQAWGSVLDAGTGQHSMRWLTGLDTERWSAVTGAASMAQQLHQDFDAQMRTQDSLVLGNWSDQNLLAGERFDIVLADYLLGAVEGFAPYTQDRLFKRLFPLVGKRLYLIGLEPYVTHYPADEGGRLLVDIGRLRDACLLLAGELPYREYPSDWVVRHLEQAGFRVDTVQHFPIRYRERFVNGQLDMCVHRIKRLQDRVLADALDAHVKSLRSRALGLVAQNNGIRLGADYVVVAEPIASLAVVE